MSKDVQVLSADGRSRVAVPFAIGVAICALYCGLAASRTWPVIDGDGPAYFPAAVEWSRGRALTNPVWPAPLDDSIDGPGGRRYIYHGFLYPIATGTVARAFGGGVQATIWAAYVVHFLAATFAGLAILSWSAHRSGWRPLLALLLPCSALAFSVATHGRVEPLAILILSVIVLSWRWLPTRWADGLAGTGVALLLFTSPVCGLLGACALVAGLLLSAIEASLLSRFAAVTIGWLVGALTAVWIYPFPIGDWVGGVRRHSLINLSLPAWQGFVPTWVTAAELPLLGLSIGLLAIGASSQVIGLGARGSTSRRIAAAAFVALFSVGLVRVAFVKTEASYNAIVWMPLLAALALSGGPRLLRTTAVLLALLPPIAGLARSSVVLSRQFDAGAVGFERVRQRLHDLPPGQVSVTTGLWMAVDDMPPVSFTGLNQPQRRFFLRQQVKSGQTQPPALPGYDLRENQYGPGMTWFGVPVSRTSGGWEFALYERAP